MKKRILVGYIGAVALFFATAASAATITFGEVVDHVDRRVHTKMNIDQYWKRVKGQEVTWTGVVYDVESGRSQVRILVADKSRPLYKGYNIRVITKDFEKAGKIKKGQQIRFKGVLEKYHPKNAGAVIDLDDATVF